MASSHSAASARATSSSLAALVWTHQVDERGTFLALLSVKRLERLAD